MSKMLSFHVNARVPDDLEVAEFARLTGIAMRELKRLGFKVEVLGGFTESEPADVCHRLLIGIQIR